MSATERHALEGRIASGGITVGVIGLGYVGLPLSIAFAEAGIRVLGFDIVPERVAAVNAGRSFIGDVASERVRRAREQERIEATLDKERLPEAEALILCVPTPLTQAKEPDLQYVTREAEQISRRLRRDQLIVLESTTYPGTTEGVVLPILLRSGLRRDEVLLAYSPERIDPGSTGHTIRDTPKLVGGIDEASTRLAALLYGHICAQVIPVASPRVAEMAKVFENVFRAVNIALVNELAQLCEKMRLDVWDVIQAAATKPFGFMPFRPGPGVGGHCIPLDPYFLASKAREYDFHTRFIELAGAVNEEMPYYVARRVADALNTKRKSVRGSRVLMLGIAYKKDVGDVRESPALTLFKALEDGGADVSYYDPHVPYIQLEDRRIAGLAWNTADLAAWDCVVVAVDHAAVNYEEVVARASLVFDARGVTAAMGPRPNVVRL
jgi:UDP-N-acetyl-D-glucosamine dehydrogenase